MGSDRRGDLDRFYQLLARLEDIVGGKQGLADCDGYMDWPDRGLYFFLAPIRQRATSSHIASFALERMQFLKAVKRSIGIV